MSIEQAEAPGQPVAEWWLIEHDHHPPEVWRQRLTDGDKRAGFRERALFSAPPTYADAEAKGFDRGIEAAGAVRFPEGWRERFDGMDLKKQKIWSDGFNACRDAIRSLASPAPATENK